MQPVAELGSGSWPKPGFPHWAVFCITSLWAFCPPWPMGNQAAGGCQWRAFHTQPVALSGTAHQCWGSSPTLSLFSKQIRENDQWDVPGGDCAADPDWPDQAGSPLPWADFRAPSDQRHLWNKVPVPDWKVTCEVHLLSVRGPDWDMLLSCWGPADLRFTKKQQAWLGRGLPPGAAPCLQSHQQRHQQCA